VYVCVYVERDLSERDLSEKGINGLTKHLHLYQCRDAVCVPHVCVPPLLVSYHLLASHLSYLRLFYLHTQVSLMDMQGCFVGV